MIADLIVIGAMFALGIAGILYWWWTAEPPGEHARTSPEPAGEHPYPPAPVDPIAWMAAAVWDSYVIPARPLRELDHRLFDTGELRALAYAGDAAAIEADTAAWTERWLT